MDFQNFASRELASLADRLADAAKAQTDSATGQLHANFEAAMDRLRTDHSQLVIENERLNAENAALGWEKRERLERLVTVFERIAASRTVHDALLAAAGGLADEFGRVAIVVGGDTVAQLGAEAMPVDPASPTVLAVPVDVRGERLAIIYADSERQSEGDGPKLAKLLQRHIALALDRLTFELKTIGELRSYAVMLLDEVEYVYSADVSTALAEPDRLERLKENLRCARQIFQQRVTLEGPAAASVLEDLIRERVEAKAATNFGQELAAAVAVGQPITVPASNSA